MMLQGGRSVCAGAASAAILAVAGLASPAAAQCAPEDERQIRGVWLRPPNSLITLESHIQDYADAGIEDLFLETFYWGLATNDSDVFQDRFSFDYLAEAIKLGAEYGVRVHAWLEAGYWSFGTTGSYLFVDNPDWKVRDYLGNTDLGDISGQTFVNLGNPGVQAMLGDFCTELASGYPGLWGVHTDYHRFPLDNNGSDGQPAPYSYDAWTFSAFNAIYGPGARAQALNPAGALWDEFVEFRRAGIAQAAQVMNDAVIAGDPGVQFSGAIFASAMTSSSQIVKMQDWPRMAQNGWLPIVVPMAYGFSTASIRGDLQLANAQAGDADVVAGLAILTNASRPSISSQLSTAYGEGIESFVFFDGLVINNDPGRVTELRNYVLGNGPFQSGDFDQNARLERADIDAFDAVFSGVPVRAAGPSRRFDLDDSGFIDEIDREELIAQFRAYRFGADGVVNAKDYEAMVATFTTAGQPRPLHLYDLNGDAAVDCADVDELIALATEPLPAAITPDLDQSGMLDFFDVLAYLAAFDAADPIADNDGNGMFDFFDVLAYLAAFDGPLCP
mgnify:CR=1 FL=1